MAKRKRPKIELNWRKDPELLKEKDRLSKAEEWVSKEIQLVFWFGFLYGQLAEAGEKPPEIYFRPENEYPDAILYDPDTGKVLNVEFEARSSNFEVHDHDPAKCDLIVCFLHDEEWENPVPVFAVLEPAWYPPKKSKAKRS